MFFEAPHRAPLERVIYFFQAINIGPRCGQPQLQHTITPLRKVSEGQATKKHKEHRIF